MSTRPVLVLASAAILFLGLGVVLNAADDPPAVVLVVEGLGVLLLLAAAVAWFATPSRERRRGRGAAPKDPERTWRP